MGREYVLCNVASICALVNHMQVVLIHGLSIPSIMWRDIAPTLAQNGFRVLVYGMFSMLHSYIVRARTKHGTDLYGRGYSDAPKAKYDATLYLTQLALLLQHVGWHKVYVAGVSMVCENIYRDRYHAIDPVR
jgi:pimeloyl-ACP methyl ester carboxylesterase